RHPAVVAIVQVPHVRNLRLRLRRNLVPDFSQFAFRRFVLDYVGAEVGQNDRRSGTSDEARKIDNLQSGENVVSWICVLSWHKCFLSCLATLELCGALLQECLCSFFLVFRSGTESEERSFQ